MQTGTIIAKRYRIERRLGKGGMGEVFAAEQIHTGHRVALKLLRAESKTKRSAIERFRREARASGAIRSNYVTEVLDVDEDPQYGIVLVFELLEGESLVERLKRTGPISFVELWGLVEAVWMGLADAHAADIVHRDLKPSNVFLVNGEENQPPHVKILDFGISKLPSSIIVDTLTHVGQSLGTFSFMPPEQIGKAKHVDHRADIYACTTLIYQALSGRLPYSVKNTVQMIDLKSRAEPRTLAMVMPEPVSDELENFISKGLARNPDDRFQTANIALEAWRALRPPGGISSLDEQLPASNASTAHEMPTLATIGETPSDETTTIRRGNTGEFEKASAATTKEDELKQVPQGASAASPEPSQTAPLSTPPNNHRPATLPRIVIVYTCAALGLILLGFIIVALLLQVFGADLFPASPKIGYLN